MSIDEHPHRIFWFLRKLHEKSDWKRERRWNFFSFFFLEKLRQLKTRRMGDPIPQGVISVNPFSSNPWDFPEDSWYLLEENPNEEKWEGDVRRTENGFWKWSSTVTIPTESALGFRNVFDFYQGNTPVGTRTGWIMRQYHAGPNRERATHVQENISLCRLLWQNMERANSSRPNNSPSACADFCTLEPDMITIKEEREAGGNVSVNVSQDSFIELNDLMSSDGEISELYDFSDRDFLEFNDILTSDTASTSSENSSDMSVNSEEYYNIGDMLREITRYGRVSVEEEKDDCISNDSSTGQQADSVLPEEGPSTSANSCTGQVKQNLPDRSEGVSCSSSSYGSSTSGSGNGSPSSNKSSSSKTPQSKRRKSVKKLAKMGKKLFCFL